MSSSNWGDAWAGSFGLPLAASLSTLPESLRSPWLLNLDALLEWQRDDWEALLEAARQGQEGLLTAFERRSEMLQKWLLRWQEGVSGPPALLPLELLHAGMGQALDDCREVAEIEAQACAGAWRVLQDRLMRNLDSLQDLWRLR